MTNELDLDEKIHISNAYAEGRKEERQRIKDDPHSEGLKQKIRGGES